ncbi:MAG: RodZ domain-containing protein [Woeseiaceae bacterium]
MSDKHDNSTEQSPDGDGPRGGERLAEARREQQISVLEVAKELHLDEPKVHALERNDFDVLGAPVFAKGHLRKYAQLVGVDEADVFADYYAMTRTSAAPPLVVRRKKIRQEFSPGPWIALISILLVAAGGYWWFFVRDADTPSVPVEPDSSQPGELQPEPAQPEQVQPEQLQSDEAAADVESNDEPIVLAAAAPSEEAAPPATTQQLPDGHIRLAISFNGDCWTEISDADGRQLFVNMGHNGQSVDLSGKAPLSALFGNADNVSLRVDGNDFALPASSSANRMVRVAIVSQ